MKIQLTDRYRKRAQRLAKHLRKSPEFDVMGVDGEKAALIAMAKGISIMEQEFGLSDVQNEVASDQRTR